MINYKRDFEELVISRENESPVLKLVAQWYKNNELTDDDIALWVDGMKTVGQTCKCIYDWCQNINYFLLAIGGNKTNLLLQNYFFIQLHEFLTDVRLYFREIKKLIQDCKSNKLMELPVQDSDIQLINDIVNLIEVIYNKFTEEDMQCVELLRIHAAHPLPSKYKIRLNKDKNVVRNVSGPSSPKSDELREEIYKNLINKFNNSTLIIAKRYSDLIKNEFGLLMKKIDEWHESETFPIV